MCIFCVFAFFGFVIVYVCVYAHAWANVYLYVYVRKDVCVCVFTYVHMSTCIDVHLRVYISICRYMPVTCASPLARHCLSLRCLVFHSVALYTCTPTQKGVHTNAFAYKHMIHTIK